MHPIETLYHSSGFLTISSRAYSPTQVPELYRPVCTDICEEVPVGFVPREAEDGVDMVVRRCGTVFWPPKDRTEHVHFIRPTPSLMTASKRWWRGEEPSPTRLCPIISECGDEQG